MVNLFILIIIKVISMFQLVKKMVRMDAKVIKCIT